MDCRTAHLLLTLDRPHAPELSPEDRAQLGRHLAACPACRAFEQAERLADEAVGRAMHDVPVPSSLEADLHRAVDRRDADDRRRWWRQAGRWTVAAAGVLFLIGGGVFWAFSFRTVVDPEDLYSLVMTVTPPTRADAQNAFRAEGVTTELPLGLNYEFLVDHRLAKFQGRLVPCLTFDDVDAPRHFARVFVLPAREFDLKALADCPPSPSGYPYRVRVQYQPGGLYAYVFLHTGDDLTWLYQKSS